MSGCHCFRLIESATIPGMDTFIDGLVVLLPTFLAVVSMWGQPPKKKHALKWRVGLICFGVFISGLTYRQLHQQKEKSETSEHRAANMEKMLLASQGKERETHRKLDESILREQRINDQNNDLRTDIQALKRSLPVDVQKRADKIPKLYRRELYEDIDVQDSLKAEAPK
jgi:hypothetical protein